MVRFYLMCVAWLGMSVWFIVLVPEARTVDVGS